MLQCIPIRDLKNTTLISEMCHANDEPIMITKNGYQDMVIMSAEVYGRWDTNRSFGRRCGSHAEVICWQPIPEVLRQQ